jgi:aspartyl-tRNA(Asn)/glutamyl-tRNA(Gln) amidotransferase subunit A
MASIPPLHLPLGRVSGRALAALVTAVRKTPARAPLVRLLRAELGIDAARALAPERRGELPFSHAPLRARGDHARPSQNLALPGGTRGARALFAAYRDGRASPERVVERALDGARELGRRSPPLGPLSGYDDARARAAARSSRERYARGASLGVFDGAPIGVKEEVNVEGYPARLGTRFIAHDRPVADAIAVARLRAAGAIVIGPTPMTEFGLSPLGANVHRRMPRNPHDPARLPGGSSSGSAVAVATGLTPASLGADGGGSIRVPAALCGVFGLKPSYGRIPTTGLGFPGATSVVHLGPIAATSHDLAEFLSIASGRDDGDEASWAAPALEHGELERALGRGVKGLRIGIDEAEWARAADDVTGPAREALDALEREGAELVPVRIELARHAAAIGYLTIGIEAFTGLAEIRARHMDDLSYEVQLLLSGLETFRPDDYLDAQRLRSALRREVAAVLRGVDVLGLPTTGRSAPPVSDDEAKNGFIDPPALDAICRYAFLANLTGLPAGTAPIGFDAQRLPLGLQIIGDAWDEACVLQVLAHLERIGAAESARPPAYVDLLG